MYFFYILLKTYKHNYEYGGCEILRWYEKVQKKVKVTLKQAMKAQRGVEV